MHADFVPLMDPIETEYAEGTVQSVTLHDGSVVNLHKVVPRNDALQKLMPQFR